MTRKVQHISKYLYKFYNNNEYPIYIFNLFIYLSYVYANIVNCKNVLFQINNELLL